MEGQLEEGAGDKVPSESGGGGWNWAQQSKGKTYKVTNWLDPHHPRMARQRKCTSSPRTSTHLCQWHSGPPTNLCTLSCRVPPPFTDALQLAWHTTPIAHDRYDPTHALPHQERVLSQVLAWLRPTNHHTGGLHLPLPAQNSRSVSVPW